MATKQFILIQEERYRLSNIKRYKPFEREDLTSKFGIYVYFSMTGNSGRVYHVFDTAKDRDEILTSLDEVFGV